MIQYLFDVVNKKIEQKEEIVISRFNENLLPIVYKTPVAIINDKLAIGPLTDEQRLSISKEIQERNICRVALNVVLNDERKTGSEVIIIGRGEELYKREEGNVSDEYYLYVEIEEIV